MRTKINGVSLNYEITGEGRTLVLTHGIGGSLGSWSNVAPRLAGSFQVLTWDVRGFGDSDKPDEEYSPELFAGDLHLRLEKLNIDKVALLGHSMGGVIAQRFVLDYPDSVEALILEATSSEVGPKAVAGWDQRIRAIEEGGMERVAASGGRAFAPSFAAAHPELIEQRQRLTVRNDPRAYIRAVRAISHYNYTSELSRIECPTLILQGDLDLVTPPGGSVIMSRNIPGSQLKIYEDCGHVVHIEKEPEFVTDLLQFLGSL